MENIKGLEALNVYVEGMTNAYFLDKRNGINADISTVVSDCHCDLTMREVYYGRSYMKEANICLIDSMLRLMCWLQRAGGNVAELLEERYRYYVRRSWEPERYTEDYKESEGLKAFNSFTCELHQVDLDSGRWDKLQSEKYFDTTCKGLLERCFTQKDTADCVEYVVSAIIFLIDWIRDNGIFDIAEYLEAKRDNAVPANPYMREATAEEKESIDKYVGSISVKGNCNFWNLLNV